MDKFKREQLHYIGIGGIKCKCCNKSARRSRNKVDKKLNRMARARTKAAERSLYKRRLYNVL